MTPTQAEIDAITAPLGTCPDDCPGCTCHLCPPCSHCTDGHVPSASPAYNEMMRDLEQRERDQAEGEMK